MGYQCLLYHHTMLLTTFYTSYCFIKRIMKGSVVPTVIANNAKANTCHINGINRTEDFSHYLLVCFQS